jgi:ABC-type phosphate/phosphonate transport system permease subunit
LPRRTLDEGTGYVGGYRPGRNGRGIGKTWLRGTFHGVSPKHLQRYLDESSYRLDRRWREGELFGFVLRRVAGGQPLP